MIYLLLGDPNLFYVVKLLIQSDVGLQRLYIILIGGQVVLSCCRYIDLISIGKPSRSLEINGILLTKSTEWLYFLPSYLLSRKHHLHITHAKLLNISIKTETHLLDLYLHKHCQESSNDYSQSIYNAMIYNVLLNLENIIRTCCFYMRWQHLL